MKTTIYILEITDTYNREFGADKIHDILLYHPELKDSLINVFKKSK